MKHRKAAKLATKSKKPVWLKNTAGQLPIIQNQISVLSNELDKDWVMKGLRKPIRKKLNTKNKKNSKLQSQIAAREKKPKARERIFVQTPFSCSNLERRAKFHATKPLAFLPYFLFRHDQNQYSNLISNDTTERFSETNQRKQKNNHS